MPTPVRSRSLAPLAAALLALLAGGACERIGLGRPATSARERYERGLADAGLARTALGHDWIAAGDRALYAPAPAALPLREQGFFPAGEATAAAWRLRAARGRRLTVRLVARADSGTRVFAELFELSHDTTARPRLVASADSAVATLAVDVDDADATYVLRVQPELLRAVSYAVVVETGASLAVFPVAGHDSRAVQSFWGAARDAGARRHEGVDIFAPRGTPAVAAIDGLARVDENALGGHVVFVHDPRRGQSLYYAHLDRQTVTTGAYVHAGDTVGLVGNTGNARTTPPHLHFAIYRLGEGAIDPFPWIDTRRAPGAAPGRDTLLVGRPARTVVAEVAVRAGPGDESPRVASLARHSVVAVDGASGAGWLRIRLPDGAAGYLPAAALEPLDAPVGRERLAAATPVRARPSPGAAVMTVAGAVDVPVYGRFGAFRLVEAAPGARGWITN